jgi:hypothetical protein
MLLVSGDDVLLPCIWWAAEALDRAEVREWMDIVSSCCSSASSIDHVVDGGANLVVVARAFV